MQETINQDYLTTDELAERLKCSTSKLTKERHQGTSLPYVKHGRQVLYFRPDVVAALSLKTVDSSRR